MKEIKLLSWNVNGIRAVRGKGFLEWFYKESPDVLCLQETKAKPEQLTSDLLDGTSGSDLEFEVVKLHCKRVASDTCVTGLHSALRKVRPELIHIHGPLSIISLQAALASPGVPKAATYHGDFYKARWLSNLFKCLRNHWQLPFVLKDVDRVIALTRFDMALLEEYGIEPGKIELIYPGLDPGFYRPDGPKDFSKQRVLFVGRTVYDRQTLTLPESLPYSMR